MTSSCLSWAQAHTNGCTSSVEPYRFLTTLRSRCDCNLSPCTINRYKSFWGLQEQIWEHTGNRKEIQCRKISEPCGDVPVAPNILPINLVKLLLSELLDTITSGKWNRTNLHVQNNINHVLQYFRPCNVTTFGHMPNLQSQQYTNSSVLTMSATCE